MATDQLIEMISPSGLKLVASLVITANGTFAVSWSLLWSSSPDDRVSVKLAAISSSDKAVRPGDAELTRGNRKFFGLINPGVPNCYEHKLSRFGDQALIYRISLQELTKEWQLSSK